MRARNNGFSAVHVRVRARFRNLVATGEAVYALGSTERTGTSLYGSSQCVCEVYNIRAFMMAITLPMMFSYRFEVLFLFFMSTILLAVSNVSSYSTKGVARRFVHNSVYIGHRCPSTRLAGFSELYREGAGCNMPK